MRSIHILNSLLQLTFYGLIVSVIPISKASHIDSATKACPNWVDCLRAQKKEAPLENRIADNIAQNGSKCGKWVTFPNKIVAIALKKVGAWEKPEALFASQDFIAMYKHPAYYWKHAIDYLANPIYPEEYKKIAIYGLENLGYTHYLAFAEACYKLYQANQLSEPLFQMVLGFEFLHIHPLVMGSIAKRHHKDSDIKAFLKKVDSNVEKDSLIRPLITEIVSGRLGNAWAKKRRSAYLDYKNPLPFADIIHEGYQEYKEVMIGNSHVQSSDKPPYFLMIYDHPNYYCDNRCPPLNYSSYFRYIPHDNCDHRSCHCSRTMLISKFFVIKIFRC